MWWRSHAPKARISPAALLRGYASATERPKGRQCAKAARAPMRAGAAGSAKGSLEAGGGNGAHEQGAPPLVAPEGGAGLGIEVD